MSITEKLQVLQESAGLLDADNPRRKAAESIYDFIASLGKSVSALRQAAQVSGLGFFEEAAEVYTQATEDVLDRALREVQEDQ